MGAFEDEIARQKAEHVQAAQDALDQAQEWEPVAVTVSGDRIVEVVAPEM